MPARDIPASLAANAAAAVVQYDALVVHDEGFAHDLALGRDTNRCASARERNRSRPATTTLLWRTPKTKRLRLLIELRMTGSLRDGAVGEKKER